jgi:hypothetical protein
MISLLSKTFNTTLIAIMAIGFVGCSDPIQDSPPCYVPIGTTPPDGTDPVFAVAYSGPSAAILQSVFENPVTPAPGGGTVVDVPLLINVDTTWTKDTVWRVTGKTKVLNNVTLTIEAGTTVIGTDGAYLVITKGSRIDANGTTAEPIIFDSQSHYDGGTPGAGQWGGLTLLGSAQVNEANLRYEVDDADADFDFGSTGTSANTEDSGILNNIYILNSGQAVGGENKEVNGLSLAGIGSGTIVENIYVENSGDDGVEIWGGTVNLTNITIVNALDDTFDIDNGYVGTVKNLLAIQEDPAAAGVEMTNSGDAAIVRSNPTFDGFTIVTSTAQKKEGGFYFKDKDTTGTFKNGKIIHNGLDGALHSNEVMISEALNLLSFENVSIAGKSTELYSGPSAAILQSVFENPVTPAPGGGTVVDVSLLINVDTTWTKDTVWRVTGKTKVLNNVTLTIEAGTTVIGTDGAYLVITKGSRIDANGTTAEPIIFDSQSHYDGGTPGAGQWGGLTLLGSAQVNEANLRYEVDDADPDFDFGSTAATGNAEDSGILNNIYILNSGQAVGGENKEVNGLSLAGIGSGTIVENIYVENSGDDGVEIWGGTVNLTNIIIVNALDDTFDIDNGYVGTVKNLLAIQEDPAAAGVEMTNSGDAAIVRSNPTFDGFTIVTSTAQKKEGGFYFKDKDTTGTFKNGKIIHNGLDGALHSNEVMISEALNLLSFENVSMFLGLTN